MPRYKVTMLVEFVGEYEADSRQQAEDLAIYDQNCEYYSVDSVEAEAVDGEDEE
jgi:hypothetical protein